MVADLICAPAVLIARSTAIRAVPSESFDMSFPLDISDLLFHYCALEALGNKWYSTKGQLMLKASDLFVAALENEGVDRIFGIPGEENLDTVESLRKSSI